MKVIHLFEGLEGLSTAIGYRNVEKNQTRVCLLAYRAGQWFVQISPRKSEYACGVFNADRRRLTRTYPLVIHRRGINRRRLWAVLHAKRRISVRGEFDIRRVFGIFSPQEVKGLPSVKYWCCKDSSDLGSVIKNHANA